MASSTSVGDVIGGAMMTTASSSADYHRDGVIYGGSSLFSGGTTNRRRRFDDEAASSPTYRRSHRHSQGNPSSSSSTSFLRRQRRRSDALSGAPPMEPTNSAVMSVVEQGSNIAFCCYREEENEIMIEHCLANGYETEALVGRFIQLARPTMVLVGNRIVKNQPLLQAVTKPPPQLPWEGGNGNNDNEEPEKEAPDDPSMLPGTAHHEHGVVPGTTSIPYCILPSKNFDLRMCQGLIVHKLRVLSLIPQHHQGGTTNHRSIDIFPDPDRVSRHFPLADERMYEPSSFHHLSAIIDFDSKVLVQALGALIYYLQSKVFPLDTSGIITVHRIVQAWASTHMKLSSTTFSALHIFSTEHHPLIAKGCGNAKEGFSLYAQLDRTKSKGGRQLLRQWMLKPLAQLDAIITRQDTVECFLQPMFEAAFGILTTHLRKVGPTDKILLRLQRCTTNPQDFLVLKTTLSATIAIGEVLRDNMLSVMEHTVGRATGGGTGGRPGTQLCYKYLSGIQERCHVDKSKSLRDEIAVRVDEESSSVLGDSAIFIRHGFDDELDDWKEQYDSLEDQLKLVAWNLQKKHPYLPGLSVLFLAQVGYLVALNREHVVQTRIELPQDFERIYSDDDEVYFKCDEMRVLDTDVGDLDGLIKDREKMILTELEELILTYQTELRESFDALSELDCILSFAECAVDLHFTRPIIVDHSPTEQQGHIVYIKDGRHPLQEVFTDREFVPNDVRIDDQDRVVVITGPNYSGKSCYLRQVGVLVYMAHLGSYIPATRAIISLTDQICARIATIETCTRPQSSYQLELTEMASILLTATPKSLVLIDEFGKGTNPASGIAVLGAALRKLSTIGCAAVCTTHFLELFSMDVIHDQQGGIRARRMTIHLPNGVEDDAEPLFKLEDGVASSSAGIICARNAGISHTVIDRAKEIIQIMKSNNGEVLRPLPDAMPYHTIPQFSKTEEEMLTYFASVESWETASKAELKKLVEYVQDLTSQTDSI